MSMEKTYTILAMSILLLALSACDTGSGVRPIPDVHVGSEGLSISFKQVPDQIIEDQPFVIVAELENKGANDIIQGVYVLNTQDEYFTFKEELRGAFNLKAKSLSYGLRGEKILRAWHGNSYGIGEQSTGAQINLGLIACYEYETIASPNVCIDTDPYDERVRNKACSIQDYSSVSAGNGQGAPVGVTRVEVDILKGETDEYIVPQFRIFIDNLGDGTVTSQNQARDICFGRPTREVYGTVHVTAKLGDQSLSCNKQSLSVQKDDREEDYITCILEDGIPRSVPNYLAPLRINLKYGYVSAISEKVEIIKRRE